MSLSLVGLAAQSSAGIAAETTRPLMVQPLPLPVPAPATITLPEPAPTVTADDTLGDGDTVAYPTLAAAVADQQAPADMDEEMRCLAGAIYFESKGEPLAGQLAVAEVILNRAESGRFGDTVCSVVKQPGQFSFVRRGHIPTIDTARRAYRTAIAVAKVAMKDAWDSTAGKALYFHARRVSPGWSKVKVASIGNHVFYR